MSWKLIKLIFYKQTFPATWSLWFNSFNTEIITTKIDRRVMWYHWVIGSFNFANIKIDRTLTKFCRYRRRHKPTCANEADRSFNDTKLETSLGKFGRSVVVVLKVSSSRKDGKEENEQN